MTSVLILVLFFVATLVLVVRPILGEGAPWDVTRPDDALRLMKRDKNRILRLLKDLEMERESGATGEEEYERLRSRFLHEAALVQRRLEVLESAAASTSAGVGDSPPGSEGDTSAS